MPDPIDPNDSTDHVDPVEPAIDSAEVAAEFVPGDDAVPIAFLPSAFLAHIVAGVLRDSGVHAVVVGEHAAAAFGPAGTAMGISVLIPRSRYEQAVSILHEVAEDRITRVAADSARRCFVCGYDMRGLEGTDRCPECGTSISQLLELSRVMKIAPPPRPTHPVGAAVSMVGCVVIAIAAVIAVIGMAWLFIRF